MLENSELYKTFRREIAKADLNAEERQLEEDGIVDETPAMSIKDQCGITLQPLDDPYRSKLCGHVFSKVGWDSIFKKSRGSRVRCPYGGCACMLTKKDIVPDVETERAISKLRKKKSRGKDKRLASQDAKEL